ncbi:MAG TPA: cyclic nucleotide-binding domain-containing protein [Polyangiaceae bacterium]|nr:cyclic nucleotide-binding domain-containing protein [Polyangiaceae bacterium]
MHDWQDAIIRHFTSFDGLDDLAIAGAVVVFSLFVLPRSERPQLKVPLVLIALYLLVVAGHYTFVGPIEPGSKAAFLALVLLLVALSRILFLVLVDWLLVRWFKRSVPRIFRDILQWVVFGGMTLVLFRSMGVELGSLLTTSAILTAVIGLSLQESLGNLVAGLAVRAEHPFEVGDWIEILDGQRTVGQVIEINWRATKLRTNDAFDVVVPNGLLAKSSFRNYGRPDPKTRRVVDFQAAYEVSPNQVEATVLQAIRGCPYVLTNPAPKLWLADFGESGVNYKIVYFLSDFRLRSDVESDIRTRVWYALHRASIDIPFPIRDVRIRRAGDAPRHHESAYDAEARRKLLDGIELFEHVPDQVRHALAESAEVVLYAAGETLVFEGDKGNDLFAVASGEVIAATTSATGEQVELARIGPGQLFGELSLLTGVRGASIIAARESLVLRISHAEFRHHIATVQGLGEELLTRIVERQGRFSRPEELGLEPGISAAIVRTALFDRIRRFFST